MKRFCVGLALWVLPVPALADGKTQDCGGDAYTYAEVLPAERSVRRPGPIVVLPDTLCADLAAGPNARIDSLNVFIDPRGATGEQPRTRLPVPAAPYRRY